MDTLSPDLYACAARVADFLRGHGVWSGGDIVTVTLSGSVWIVADIGMRMLRPHEAARAHELTMPALITVPRLDRQGQPIIGADGQPVMMTRPLTKTESMRLVGNSVPKRMARILATANSRHALDTIPPVAMAAE